MKKVVMRKFSFIFVVLIGLCWPGSAGATPPCPPDFSALCRAAGGSWTPTDSECKTEGRCSVPIPLVQYDCREDSDCRPCGLDQCKVNVERLDSQFQAALQHAAGVDWEQLSSCEQPFNQVCGCQSQRCVLISKAVDCRTDEDCFYCCGSCQPAAWRQVADCESSCILDPGARFDCSCIDNKCRRAG